MARRHYYTAEVEINIDDVIDDLTDDEWVEILKATPKEVLTKAGLQRVPDAKLDALSEHLQNVRTLRKAPA